MNDPNNSSSSSPPRNIRSQQHPSATSRHQIDRNVDRSNTDIITHPFYQHTSPHHRQVLPDDRATDETAVSLEPLPIRHMNVSGHIPVQELHSRDPRTAQMLREMFAYNNPPPPDYSSTMMMATMMDSSYRRISTGYYNVEETKLEPSQFASPMGGGGDFAFPMQQPEAPHGNVPSRRTSRSKKDPLFSGGSDDARFSIPTTAPQMAFSEEASDQERRSSLKPPPPNPTPLAASSSEVAPLLYLSPDQAAAAAPLKGSNDDDEEDDDEGEERPLKKARYRALKSGQWLERFQELVEYKESFGSCHVPHNWEHNVPLAQWVKRQRYQYTLREDGKHSTLTDERKEALDDIGFVWSSHTAVWLERLEELRQFKQQFGHCNVPKNYPANKALAVWIKSQRRQYKLFQRGKQGTMTHERVAKLNELGFDWDPRSTSSSSSADKKPRAKSRRGKNDVTLSYDDDSSSESSASPSMG